MKKAFTLIELIVGISISMILMVSVGIFVGGGMQNILNSKKTIDNTNDFISFSNSLHSDFRLLNKTNFSPTNTTSGIIFKKDLSYSKGGFSYIGTQELDQIYCSTDAENSTTNHIYIKNFIPFEENSEDIFSDYESILTATVGSYTSYQKNHVVKDSSGNIVVGKGVFGDFFSDNLNGDEIYLNSPTGLALDGNILFISDTLNNRVLYYNTITKKINLLLDESDGLNEPTGLLYSNTDKALYISNSGNGEILKYSSKKTNLNPNLVIDNISNNNINKIKISFFNQDQSPKPIVGPTDKSKILFSNVSKNADFLNIDNNSLEYHFVNYNSSYSEPSCTSTEEILVGGNPVRCIGSGTGQTSTYQSKSFINTDITIKNILPSFSSNQNYYVNLKLFNNSTERFSDFFSYFSQSDDDVLTSGDNTLEVIHSGLNYPTGIWGSGTNDFNIFGDFNYSDLVFHETDSLLKVPIESLEITNTPNDLISFILKYYSNYNCYNLDLKNSKTFLLKKNLK